MIADLFRYVRTLFGVRYVALIDFDGDRTVSPVFFQGGVARAWRWRILGKSVRLSDNGVVETELGYVVGWEPYRPFHRVMPKYEVTA